jgi:exopolysaccharide production protein ExoQ
MNQSGLNRVCQNRESPEFDSPARFIVAQRVLIAGFVWLTFVGLNPLDNAQTAAERVEGNPLNRVITLSFSALAIAIIWNNRNTAIACLRKNAILLGVVGFCLLSALWSDFPELTIRRGTLLATNTIIAMGIAVGANDLRRLHTSLFFWLIAIIVLNFLALALWPDQATTDIGVKGISSDKNSAGAVGMLVVVVGAAWMIGVRNITETIVGLISVLVAFIFLVLTQSKTSLGIAVLALTIIAVLVFADHFGKRFVLLVWSAALIGLAVFLGLLTAHDFDLKPILNSLNFDTSFTGRDSIWTFAWNSASERSWLGHGFGAFWDVGEANDPLMRAEPGTWLADVPKGVINEAHNGYLELWLNVGLPITIVATIAIIAGMVFDIRCYLDPTATRQTKAAYCAVGLVMFVCLLHNITEASLFTRSGVVCNLTILLRFMASRFSKTLVG